MMAPLWAKILSLLVLLGMNGFLFMAIVFGAAGIANSRPRTTLRLRFLDGAMYTALLCGLVALIIGLRYCFVPASWSMLALSYLTLVPGVVIVFVLIFCFKESNPSGVG